MTAQNGAFVLSNLLKMEIGKDYYQQSKNNQTKAVNGRCLHKYTRTIRKIQLTLMNFLVMVESSLEFS